ncbi:hypothetical protein HAX54_005699, partial [Datura stramonium]|nr:hypothetical protein [Datura stramonium]
LPANSEREKERRRREVDFSGGFRPVEGVAPGSGVGLAGWRWRRKEGIWWRGRSGVVRGGARRWGRRVLFSGRGGFGWSAVERRGRWLHGVSLEQWWLPRWSVTVVLTGSYGVVLFTGEDGDGRGGAGGGTLAGKDDGEKEGERDA